MGIKKIIGFNIPVAHKSVKVLNIRAVIEKIIN